MRKRERENKFEKERMNARDRNGGKCRSFSVCVCV